MFIQIGNTLINTDRITHAERRENWRNESAKDKPATHATVVWLAGHHDAYNGGGTHSAPLTFNGAQGDVLWEYLRRADARTLLEPDDQ